MAQMLPRYLGDVIWPRHRGMWECRRGIIRVSETEEKIGDSRSTRRCHEGAWMLACRSISILCFHLPSLVPCYSIRRPRGNSIIISTNFETNFSKNLSNLDDDLTIFPRRTISISISITHQRNLPIAKNEKAFPLKIETRKKIGTQLDPSLPPLVLVIDREKRKWKKNG